MKSLHVSLFVLKSLRMKDQRLLRNIGLVEETNLTLVSGHLIFRQFRLVPFSSLFVVDPT